jgi:tRNA (guanine37-N1)-methyltransferase
MSLESCAAVKIKCNVAETVRKRLLDRNNLRKDLKIKKDSSYVFLPIKDNNNLGKLSDIPFEIVVEEFKKLKEKNVNYKDLLIISPELKEKLPTSFDIIGNILIIRLDKESLPFKYEIGQALLSTHKHIHSVFHIDAVHGEMRTRNVHLIAGEDQKLTQHKEYGLWFHVDIEKTYFSPRLATERKFISSQVKKGEIILDMFTGVAPFPLIIAKFAQPKKIIGIDKNKYAIDLGKKNILINNFSDYIELYCDDANNSSLIMNHEQLLADRIIMNLPFHAIDFFSEALKCIKNKGFIHLYCICHEDEIQNKIQRLHKIADKTNVILSIGEIRKIKTYAPHEFYIGIDITPEKSSDMPT